jgi:undecaprenyl-diphosphatase
VQGGTGLAARRARAGWGAAAGLGFLALTLAVRAGWLFPADRAVLAWVAGWRDCGSIGVATALSVIGAGEVSLLLTGLVAAGLLLQRRPRAAVSLLLLYLSLPIELGLKLVLTQPLAGLLFPIPAACEWYHPALTALTPYSYPSGYAIRVTYFFVLAGIWLLHERPDATSGQESPGAARKSARWRPRGWTAVALLGMLLVLLLASRLVLSWHWPSDLAGGALLGVALAAATLVVGWPSATPDATRSAPGAGFAAPEA